MNSAGKVRAAFVAIALVGMVACGSSSTAANNTGSNTPGASAATSDNSNNNSNGTGTLDPAVALPSTFPSDFPIYPGARSTEQAVISSGTNNSWSVAWETLDSLDKVQAFYTAQLKQGDWTVAFEGSQSGQYSVTFTRKSNSNFGGVMSADNTSKQGVTSITLVLVSSSS